MEQEVKDGLYRLGKELSLSYFREKRSKVLAEYPINS